MPTNETLLNIRTEVNNILNDLDLFTKITKIEDFMKEKYNVEITNNAESVNGYVDYTANVTDADNVPAEGVLVQFVKANGELLGRAVSDSEGNVAISLKQQNDIFTFIANVEATPYGDMQERYIGAAGNLMPLNVWSGTDITHDRTGFVYGAGVSVSSSTEWASIGECSLEMIKIPGISNFTVYADSTEFIGFEALTCKFDVITGEGTMVCRLGTPNYLNIASTTVPASDEMQTVMLTALIPPGETIGRVSFIPQTNNVTMNVDNIYVSGAGENNFMFFDPGVTGTRADWRDWNSNGKRTPTSTGTLVECTADTNYMVFANSYGTSASTYDFNAPYTVEFDVGYHIEDPLFQIYSRETVKKYEIGITTNGHYKITYDGQIVRCWIDGVEQPSQTYDLPLGRIGWRVLPGKSLKFTNFMIYKGVE